LKILQVGSKSIHVQLFIQRMQQLTNQKMNLIAEESCQFESVEKEFLVSFRSSNPLKIWKNYQLLKIYLKEISPTIIHIHQANRLAYFVTRRAARLEIPVVLTAWGSDVLTVPQKNSFYRYLIRKIILRSFRVTADAHEMIQVMKKLVPAEKYIHLQYGITAVEPMEKEDLIFSNRLHRPLYRIDQIIRYFAEFSKNHPTWKLVVAAEGTETSKLVQLVHELTLENKVNFVGWLTQEQNHSYYAKSKIFISIPESDGSSVSLLEAISAACIPIVSNLPANLEWVRDDVNGIIEKETNPLFEYFSLANKFDYSTNRKRVIDIASSEFTLQKFFEIYSLVGLLNITIRFSWVYYWDSFFFFLN
jgi:L-malate glycosyltransferase